VTPIVVAGDPRAEVGGCEVRDEHPVDEQIQHDHDRATDQHRTRHVAARLGELLARIDRRVPAAVAERDEHEGAEERLDR
jgi:hypothetical protein